MAHDLYQDKLAYTGEIPWHGLGTRFDEEFTAAQAIEAAGLGYLVTKEPVFRKFGDEVIEVPNHFVTVNQENQEVLGMVGKVYEILQNKQAFDFFDIIQAETGARFSSAAALGKGELMWLMAKLPDSFRPLLGDRVDKFCLLSTGHTGRTGSQTQVRFGADRVVCRNTLMAAMRGVKETISIRHTESNGERLQQAAMIVKEMNAHFTRLGETFEEMASLKINDEWIENYEALLFGPVPTDQTHTVTKNIRERNIAAFETRLSTGMGTDIEGVKGTVWGAYNAAIEWADYEFPQRGKDKDRTMSILFGKANEFKQTAFDSAMALVAR
jgi:phage/plasmid-like protein (TIGR03299 family)